MSDLLDRYAVLDPPDVDWLHRLLAEWQLLADLSFADLLLWVGVPDGQLLVIAQLRPTTGPTAHQDDLVGLLVPTAARPEVAGALADGRIRRETDPAWVADLPVREEAIPVRRGDRVVAVVSRETNLAAARTPSRLELTYLETADDLAQMIAEGSFPFPTDTVGDGVGPRVGDGLIRVDGDGAVTFASPNAQSAFRRLGLAADLVGVNLRSATESLQPALDGVGQAVGEVLRGRAPGIVDIETEGAAVQLRSIPLRPGGERIGAVVLVHDVTELRWRDRQLVSKDATIREIHHRVKNNLQTVAALLRLQARRLDEPAARAALEESMRRVGSIALVHEMLSFTPDDEVDFDAVADQLATTVADVSAGAAVVGWQRTGSFGRLPGALATSLAMVLSELVQNAVEHAFAGRPGRIELTVDRQGNRLTFRLADDGAGLPAGFSVARSDRLGLSIVRTLVEQESGGRLRLASRPGGGTEAVVEIPSITSRR
jgi:two-component sensor histidine kinase